MLGVDDKCVDAGVANHHDEFSTRRPEVEGYEYRAETRDGEHRGQERRLVQAEERRACAALDPEFPQVSRHGANATLHLGVGPSLTLEGQGLPFRSALCPLREPVRQTDVGCHVILPSFARPPLRRAFPKKLVSRSAQDAVKLVLQQRRNNLPREDRRRANGKFEQRVE